jgi:FMN reductase
MSILIVGTSLDPESKSQMLARVALDMAHKAGYDAELLDLREITLPFAGEENSFDDPQVVKLKEKMSAFKKFIFCVPVYNFDVSAAAKNLLELVGDNWLENSTVGFICSAGGQSSYMSVMSFANSLMLDFRVWIVPRFVYSLKSDWQDGELKNDAVRERMLRMLEEMVAGPK